MSVSQKENTPAEYLNISSKDRKKVGSLASEMERQIVKEKRNTI